MTRRRSRFAAALLCLAAAAAGAQTAALPVEEAQRGQRGYGLSVFEGNRVETFDVEVLGVLRNVSPDTSYIMARLSGRGLERTGVIAGMSGSPTYIDGRLAGAVAYSWAFSDEAIALITPIASMRALGVPAVGRPAAAAAGPLADFEVLRQLTRRGFSSEALESSLGALMPAMANGAIPSVQWSAGGFGEGVRGLLERRLVSVAPAGGAAVADPSALVPGGSVAAVVVDGDLRLAAVATVTDRQGDEVLAFGHPFLGVGPLEIPMAPAEVVTVVSSRLSSFKVANFGEPVGAFDQDRLAGLRGTLGRVAPTLPLVVHTPARDYRMRVARLPQMLPMLVAVSALGSLEAASYLNGAQGLDLDATFRLRGYGDLQMRQSFDGEQAALQGALYVLTLTSFLTQTRLDRIELEAVELDFTHHPAPRTAALVGAHADRAVVRPGERVTLNLDLVAYRGEPFRRSIAIDLPADLPAGPYSLLLGDGATIDAARLSIEPAPPVNFSQAMELLRGFHAGNELVVLGVHGGRGLAVAGRVMPRLPGSVRSLWGSAASGTAVPLRLAVAQEHVEVFDVPIEGAARIDLEVRRREPVSAEGESGAAPAKGTAAEAGRPPTAPAGGAGDGGSR
jgi:hypothetical protein